MNTHLRKLRTEKGITISELAAAVQIDVGNLSRIERGIQLTSLENAKRIVDYFNGAITAMEILYPNKF
ncbi:helix-turn-helix domain-containing protein [Rosenbergiella epipactidis]|uniref:helix-turn-helix domain-containing protein n=1 Tax=Rosenbergiella epipactidis TaxID=1544694 RepID=UPI001F4D403B|nr:helix-turn-helix transcriptional regulator [Rosenbergiella epipactidis]